MKIKSLLSMKGDMKGKWALVTGASSGIGRDIASTHAFHGGNLVLVARRKDRLDKLKKALEEQCDAKVEVIVKDLAQANAVDEIYKEVKAKKIPITMLVNNAGLGLRDSFHQQSLEDVQVMLDVNMRALTLLTHAFLPDMVKRRKGYILNVASIAGFLPMPFMAVYAATKAYVVSFSQGLASEVDGEKIHVTALCPGLTSTEFMDVAGLQDSGMVKFVPQASSRKVAELGYRATLQGRWVVRDTWFGVLMTRFLWHLMPRRSFLKVSRYLTH